MMKGILDAYAGESTGILSTVETFTGGEVRESHLTTPESLDLQRMFDEARANHLRYVTMEVSSQAYKHSRAYGISYDVGVFLNIDEDHIGPLEHTDYEDYLSCKLELVKNSRIAVINSLTRDFARVVEAARSVGAKVVRFGAEGDDYSIRNIRKLQSGFCFEVFGPNHWNAEFSIDLEGRFNMTNALAAIAAAKELGVDDDSIRRGIQSIFVPGRMNIYRKNGALVLVDYAHNHLSFTELFESLKKDYPGQPVKVVCGCPGHKNMRRRRDIGLLCGKYASKVYLTAEDPGFESVEEICEEMAEYVRMDQRAEYVIIPDRAQAVKTSLEEAKEGDIIIVAGKGEEIYQKVCGEYLPYESDVVIVREWAQNDKGDQNADC